MVAVAPPEALLARLFETKPRKGDLRKLAMAQAAITSLATEGIENTTLDSIGKRLGIRRSHVVYYFKMREELVAAAICLITVTAQDITVRKVSAAATARERLIAIVDGAFRGECQMRTNVEDGVELRVRHLAVVAASGLSKKVRADGARLQPRRINGDVKRLDDKALLPCDGNGSGQECFELDEPLLGATEVRVVWESLQSDGSAHTWHLGE